MLFFLKKSPHTISKSNVMMIFTREELCGQNTFILKLAYLNKVKKQISVHFVGVSNFDKASYNQGHGLSLCQGEGHFPCCYTRPMCSLRASAR